MSQQDESIFKGLPTKGTVIETEPFEAPVRRRWLTFGIAGAAVLLVAAAAIVVPTVLSNQQPQAQSPAPELSLSPEEIAEADAAIADGGGAIPGHIVSGELCDAVDAYVAAGSADQSATGTSPEITAALESLAAVESPNQRVFSDYLSMIVDPASVSDLEDIQELSTDFEKALQVDITTCL